jgi:hypothetical protein
MNGSVILWVSYFSHSLPRFFSFILIAAHRTSNVHLDLFLSLGPHDTSDFRSSLYWNIPG